MAYWYIASITNPEFEEQLRRANEARAATWYAAYKSVKNAIGDAVTALIAAVKALSRQRNAGRTYRARPRTGTLAHR